MRGVSRRSVSGIDALHSGMKSAARRSAFQVRLTRQFEWHGLKSAAEPGRPRARVEGALGPSCHFLGVTPDAWIGPLRRTGVVAKEARSPEVQNHQAGVRRLSSFPQRERTKRRFSGGESRDQQLSGSEVMAILK